MGFCFPKFCFLVDFARDGQRERKVKTLNWSQDKCVFPWGYFIYFLQIYIHIFFFVKSGAGRHIVLLETISVTEKFKIIYLHGDARVASTFHKGIVGLYLGLFHVFIWNWGAGEEERKGGNGKIKFKKRWGIVSAV